MLVPCSLQTMEKHARTPIIKLETCNIIGRKFWCLLVCMYGRSTSSSQACGVQLLQTRILPPNPYWSPRFSCLQEPSYLKTVLCVADKLRSIWFWFWYIYSIVIRLLIRELATTLPRMHAGRDLATIWLKPSLFSGWIMDCILLDPWYVWDNYPGAADRFISPYHTTFARIYILGFRLLPRPYPIFKRVTRYLSASTLNTER